MSAIKNIIFDLGNVIIDLDIPRTERKFKELLGEHYEQAYSKLDQEGLFLDYEVGNLTEEAFVDAILSEAPNGTTYQAVIDAWNGMLLGIPASRLDMLARLKKVFQVFLLSNTNATHVDWVDWHLRERHNMSIFDFDDRFFHKPYYSHLINLRKPGREVFDFVLTDAGLEAAETLFIDDNADNVAGAMGVGIQARHHLIGDEITERIDQWLNAAS